MIKSLCLLSAKFSYGILMLDSCFFYAMKNCALFKAALRYIFLTLWFLASENSDERDFFKMVKLTNSLVEPRTHKFWHSF
jgi:hypothetical protein